jgi:hypothetical protein
MAKKDGARVLNDGHWSRVLVLNQTFIVHSSLSQIKYRTVIVRTPQSAVQFSVSGFHSSKV